MEINVIVYSKSVARGEKSFDLSALFSLCNKYGVSIKNFLIKENYDFEITEKFSQECPLIIFCEKLHMELYEINLSYKFSAEREVFCENCVKLKNGMNVVFIPFEEDYIHYANEFLKEINNSEKTSIFRLFGKSGRYVKKLLQDNNINLEKVKVVEENLLCDIIVSEPKDNLGVSEIQQKIGQLFINEIYSESNLSLKDVVVNILKMKRQKLDIIEPFTCGEISRQFACDSDVIYEALIPISNRALTVEGQMTGFDFQNGGECSVETNTFLSKSRLSLNGADIILTLTAKEIEGGFQEIMSIADHFGVNSIKTTYRGKREDAIKFSVNWALYNLVKKLRKKDFENN